MSDKEDRLFVPLKSEPFSWFLSGAKLWELRRQSGQYKNIERLRLGRKVELRRGYGNPKDALWGKIVAVISADNLEDFFDRVQFEDVIPTVSSRAEAIRVATRILRLDQESDTKVVGFKVEVDRCALSISTRVSSQQ
jgi:ASC-1-like (ASCH) protein